MNNQVKRELRSAREIQKMRAAGLIVWEAHQAGARVVKPGVTTAEINQVYIDTFKRHDAQPLFLNYGEPPFPAETCISVNEEVVHGIPGRRIVEAGDIVSVDTGCRINGWCGDAAMTHAVGDIDAAAQRLLQVTNDVLNLAIKLIDHETQWSGVCKQMEAFVHEAGFHVIEGLVGHGIGKELHEAPSVPNFFDAQNMIENDFDLRPGVVIAIEPMINEGTKEVELMEDDWTVATADASLSAHFEHTVAITRDGPVRLTGPPNDEELATMPEWLHDKSKWILW
jgi:methionyl aminopeptidase